MTAPLVRIAIASAAGAALVTLGGCDLGHKQTTQTGYRGAGLDQIVDLKHIAKASAIPAPPYPLPPDGGPTAGRAIRTSRCWAGSARSVSTI